jgi:FkbM family methyltransferase
MRVRNARQRVTRWFEARDPERQRAQVAYYSQQDSCQIRHLWYLYKFFIGEKSDGFFVEVGANDGVSVSNTWGLARRGWVGLMVEPVPQVAQTCRVNHKDHQQIRVIECAVGASDGTSITMNVAGVLTTANDAVLQEYGSLDWASGFITGTQMTVPVRTLDSILVECHAPAGFDVLVVDVEGFEADVFAGFSLSRWQPQVIVVELADTHPDLHVTAASDAQLGVSIQDAGYRVCFKDTINTVYVRNDTWAAAYAS